MLKVVRETVNHITTYSHREETHHAEWVKIPQNYSTFDIFKCTVEKENSSFVSVPNFFALISI